MIGPGGYRSSLARAAASSAPSEEGLLAMRRAAWRQQGVEGLLPGGVGLHADVLAQRLAEAAQRLEILTRLG